MGADVKPRAVQRRALLRALANFSHFDKEG